MNSKTAAIYARYSTDLQNDRSIEDQVALCRAYADREGLQVVGVHADRAKTGGSMVARDGLAALIEDARAGRVGVIIVEALDRLSRDMEDLAGLHKRLTFLGVEIRAVHEGTVNTVLVGLRGLIGQLYREDNAHKVRRGQEGRIKSGLSAGGLTYGYTTVPGEPGARAIIPEQAEIVRRIFAAYVAGQSPREIAATLTRERIPSPTRGKWNASTISGSKARGIGILRNEIYAGRRVWNRVRMVRDPETGSRVSRVNHADTRTARDVPELAIVDLATFDAAQDRIASRGGSKPWTQRRPKRMLSGMLRCGNCGAGMSTAGTDKSGRVRVRCSGHRERGDCEKPVTSYLDVIERTVVEGLRAEMRDPRLLAEYVREYHAERQRLAAGEIAQRGDLERRLASVGKEADRVTEWMIKGVGDIDRLDRRAKELMADEAELKARLAAAPEVPNVVTLHPQALAHYETQLADLAGALGRAIDQNLNEAADAIRDLVQTVTVSRTDAGEISIVIEGRLNALLGEKAFPNRVRMSSGGKVVAEEGLEPPTPGL